MISMIIVILSAKMVRLCVHVGNFRRGTRSRRQKERRDRIPRQKYPYAQIFRPLDIILENRPSEASNQGL